MPIVATGFGSDDRWRRARLTRFFDVQALHRDHIGESRLRVGEPGGLERQAAGFTSTCIWKPSFIGAENRAKDRRNSAAVLLVAAGCIREASGQFEPLKASKSLRRFNIARLCLERVSGLARAIIG